MTKKTFLEKLEKKLAVLNAEEKKDIILEYKGIIEEKVKNGMKEEEAVADFGDFDEFVSEILSAYKIDPHIHEEKDSKEKAQDILETGEELIREGAKKLSDATEKLVTNIKESNEEITVELIFELLLKGLCALLIMGFLTLPFLLISHIGDAILGFIIFPIDHILQFIWKIIISLLYLATCAFLVIAMFKGYIKKPEDMKEDKKLRKKESNQGEMNKKEKGVKNTKAENRENKKEIKNTSNSASQLIIILLKLFIIFFFLFPIWICIICGFLFLAVLFYFLLKGIGVLGLMICTIAFIAFLVLLSRVLYHGIFHNAKIRLYPFIITLVFALIGIVMTFDFFTSFEYISAAPLSHVEKKSYVIDLVKPTYIEDDFTLVIDNTIEDGKAVIEASYYDDFINIEKNEEIYSDRKVIHVYIDSYGFSSKKMYKLVMDNLKQNKIYDYDALDEVTITVKVNSNTQNLVKND